MVRNKIARMANPEPQIQQIRDLFAQTQFSKRNHPAIIAKLKELYKTMDEEIFAKAFIRCLYSPLSVGEKSLKVENALSFAVAFAVGLHSFRTEVVEEGMCPFLTKLFDFILENHDTADASLRYRICFFLNMILGSMGRDAFLDDVICDGITRAMLERMIDKLPKVRAQAVLTLHRLQDPADPECPVIKAFIFHMTRDPQARVRSSVLSVIGKNKLSLAAVLKRTRDVDDGVRKAVFTFLTHITVKSMTIEQREKLLCNGLRDRSDKVRECVETLLLPTWLEQYNGNYIQLLRALDAEKALDISILMLKVFFKNATIRSVVEQVPVDSDTKLIPFDKLSAESVIYLRCVVEHLHRAECLDEAEALLPDLVKFCQYIGKFVEYIKQETREPWDQETLNFILHQLFEICKSYDLCDEVGREHLRDLILDTLKSDHNSEGFVYGVVRVLVKVVDNIDERLEMLAEVISELRMPPSTTQCVPMSEAEKHEKNMKKAKLRVQLLQAEEEQYQVVKDRNYLRANELDKHMRALTEQINELNTDPIAEVQVVESVMRTDEKALSRCLEIMYAMMQDTETPLPLFKSLFQDMVLPCFDHPTQRVVKLAIMVTTNYCLKDVEAAKKYIPIFLVQFTVENNVIWLATLKGIFDLLVKYGLETFDMVPEAETSVADTTTNTSSRRLVRLFSDSASENIASRSSVPPPRDTSNRNSIKFLTELLDNTDQDLRTVATNGLAKLLLHRRIASASLLSKLIILWHNPVTEDDACLRQCLTHFFDMYPTLVPDGKEMLEQCFFPTLKTLANAPDDSPLQKINPVKVADLILYLTRPDPKAGPLAYVVHDHLAVAILTEALNDRSAIDPRVLINSLKFLIVDLENESRKKCLQEAVEELLSKIKSTEKRAVNSVLAFKKRLYPQTGTERNDVAQDASDAEAASDPESDYDIEEDESDE